MIMTILRKFTVVVLALSLCITTVACGGGEQTTPTGRNVSQTSTATKLSDGQYQVQQATYDDSTGEYTLFLLNSKPPTFTTENVQMARLTDEEIKAGKKSYLKVENGQPALYLTEDFKIEYVHNVTQTQNNPQTGQQETVVVRRENSFWSPFAGSLAGSIAGQAIGSLLFRPQYYVPPVYQPGGVLNGFGGYGSTYDQAVSSYRSRYNAPPAAVRNRTAFRTTGNIRNTSPNGSNVRTTTPPRTTNRPSGSGFGSSELQPSGKSSTTKRNSGSSFGSGGRSRSPSRSGGFGSRRR
ncbi:hypothetical protein [Nostoc sp. PCC 7107]|uniref:hypothetical protein n=1 Tax=Nostoc sp. PCC 7107 TaxID=317936 RepID=UPI00029EF3F2|nr:hypothetical protein [Nostoc sp. PCC 7107]AFY42836.1 hypothetical protein Nos7107_2220 [Nostoc sp. PCC 7107]